MSIERSPSITRARVRFADHGERTMVLEYAELARVDPEDPDGAY